MVGIHSIKHHYLKGTSKKIYSFRESDMGKKDDLLVRNRERLGLSIKEKDI